MREIKFRGKSIDTGEWVYGYYYNIDDSRKGNRRHIIVYESEEPGLQTIHEPVYRETVGQYTGLKDKNGKKIYEGDIVKAFDGYENRQFTGYVIYEDGTFFIDVASEGERECVWCDYYTEVIGNIHDNPELLESEV